MGKINRTTQWISDTLESVAALATKLSGIATGATKDAPSATTPKVAGTAATGSETGFSRGDHVHPAQTTVSGNSGTATKLATARTINGTSFDGSTDITIPSFFGTCSTAAATVAKEVAVTGFALVTGASVKVLFSVTNTAASPTLNVNATGAKAIKYRNAAITAGNLAANRIYEFVYDGADYELVGDIDTNTTYSAMPVAEGIAGTATALRVLRADYLKQIIAGTATVKHKSATLDAASWIGTASPYTCEVTDADIVDGCLVECIPAVASQDVADAAQIYADLQPVAGAFTLTAKNKPTASITIKYTIEL
jgi:hypothetical protein